MSSTDAAVRALIVSASVVSLNLLIGLPLGALAGFFGGRVDTFIMRVADFLFAFEPFLFVLFIAATIRPSVIEYVKGVGSALGLKRRSSLRRDSIPSDDMRFLRARGGY